MGTCPSALRPGICWGTDRVLLLRLCERPLAAPPPHPRALIGQNGGHRKTCFPSILKSFTGVHYVIRVK